MDREDQALVRLVLLKEAARSGMFESEAAIRSMIARGQLRRGEHWFQDRPGARIRLDLDACVELFTQGGAPQPKVVYERIPVIRGGHALDRELAMARGSKG